MVLIKVISNVYCAAYAGEWEGKPAAIKHIYPSPGAAQELMLELRLLTPVKSPFLVQHPLVFSSFFTEDNQWQSSVANTCSMHQRRAPVVGNWIHGIGESPTLVTEQQGTHQLPNNFEFAAGCHGGSQSSSSGRDITSRYQTREHPPPSWRRKHCSSQIGWYEHPLSILLCECCIYTFLQYLDFGCCRMLSVTSTMSSNVGTLICNPFLRT